MEIKMETETVERFEAVFSDVLTREETAESVVPDTMPDIARLLATDTSVCMRSKTAQEGRVLLEGMTKAAILYLPEGGERICRMELQIPFTFLCEREEILETDKVVARLNVQTTEIRLLNPRKVFLRSELSAEITLYRLKPMICCVGTSEDDGLQTLITERKIGYIASVGEKNFVIAEEMALPTAKPAAAEILCSHIFLTGEDTRQVADKVILQGNVNAEILYLPTEGNTPVQERFSLPFSQILDVPETENGSVSVVLMPTSVFVETLPGEYGAAGFHVEVHAAAQSICCAERTIRYIADAYSNACPCHIVTEKTSVTEAFRNVVLRETLRERIAAAEGVREVLAWRIGCTAPEISENKVSLTLNVWALAISEHENMIFVQRSFGAEFPSELSERSAVLWTETLCGEAYFSGSGEGVELRLPLEVRIYAGETETLEMITSAEPEEDRPFDPSERPSLTLVRAGKDSLWSLAKKFGSTIKLIEEANSGGEREADWLLIPKAR